MKEDKEEKPVARKKISSNTPRSPLAGTPSPLEEMGEVVDIVMGLLAAAVAAEKGTSPLFIPMDTNGHQPPSPLPFRRGGTGFMASCGIRRDVAVSPVVRNDPVREGSEPVASPGYDPERASREREEACEEDDHNDDDDVPRPCENPP